MDKAGEQMIPKTLIQIWPGTDNISEENAIRMANNVRVCNEYGYQHFLFRIDNDGYLIGKDDNGFHRYMFEDIYENSLFAAMLRDPKIPLVMKGDILRFTAIYLNGGFYADLDLQLNYFDERWLEMPYVCGFEKIRPPTAGQVPEFCPKNPGHRKINREQNPVCTAFFGAPARSPINKEMVEHILETYEKIVANNYYPKNMWHVIDITVDPLARIIRKYPEVKPFPMEMFFPWPIPQRIDNPFTEHYYAGTQKDGWTFEQCKNEDCPKCEDRKQCVITREVKK
jgi:hypothetical protein